MTPSSRIRSCWFACLPVARSSALLSFTYKLYADGARGGLSDFGFAACLDPKHSAVRRQGSGNEPAASTTDSGPDPHVASLHTRAAREKYRKPARGTTCRDYAERHYYVGVACREMSRDAGADLEPDLFLLAGIARCDFLHVDGEDRLAESDVGLAQAGERAPKRCYGVGLLGCCCHGLDLRRDGNWVHCHAPSLGLLCYVIAVAPYYGRGGETVIIVLRATR